jgi:hypothetical protein
VLPVFRDFSLNNRPRAHERHFSASDVNQLRNLVQAGLPQETTYPSDPRVIPKLPGCTPFFGGHPIELQVLAQERIAVHRHRAKLKAVELTPTEPDTPVPIQRWSSIGKRDARANCSKQRGKHQQQSDG